MHLANPVCVKILTEQGLTEDSLMVMQQLQEQLKIAKELVIPVHSDSPLHWTAMVLTTKEQGSAEVTEVAYYDWCADVHSNRIAACVMGIRASAPKMLVGSAHVVGTGPQLPLLNGQALHKQWRLSGHGPWISKWTHR